MAGTPVLASQLLVGANVKVVFSGALTTAGASPVVALDDGSGLTVTLPGALSVIARSDPLPGSQGSVVRASVNGGAIETLVLLPNANAVLKWRAADGFHNADELSAVQSIFVVAPPALVRMPE